MGGPPMMSPMMGGQLGGGHKTTAESISKMVDEIAKSEGLTRDDEHKLRAIAMAKLLPAGADMSTGIPAPAPSEESTTTAKPLNPEEAQLSLFYQGRRLQMSPMMGGGGSGSPMDVMASMMGSQAGMEAAPVALMLGVQIKQLVTDTHEIVGKCIHSDAKDAFRLAGEHMRDLKYVRGHFLANGADIAGDLATAGIAYEEKNFTKLGAAFGHSMRKVLLSNMPESQLPEGMYGKGELANTTAGMLMGFLGKGTEMNIRLEKDKWHPVHIDVHTCVKENTPLFQMVWASTMFAFARKASGADSMQSEGLSTTTGKAQFGALLGMTMMDIPNALRRCGISEEHELMIIDSLSSMGKGMAVQLKMRHHGKMTRRGTESVFNQTVADWQNFRWFEFGEGLGQLMRNSALSVYSKKYTVDADGTLRLQLEEPLGLRRAGALWACGVAAGAAGLWMASLALLRLRRQRRSPDIDDRMSLQALSFSDGDMAGGFAE